MISTLKRAKQQRLNNLKCELALCEEVIECLESWLQCSERGLKDMDIECICRVVRGTEPEYDTVTGWSGGLLPHNNVVDAIASSLCAQGQIRLKPAKLFAQMFRPDLLIAEYGGVCGYEIKPFMTTMSVELAQGIGQCALMSACSIQSYLVIPKHGWEKFNEVLVLFPWLGVITYNDNKLFNTEMMKPSQQPISFPDIPSGLRCKTHDDYMALLLLKVRAEPATR